MKNPSRKDYESWKLVQDFLHIIWMHGKVPFLKDGKQFKERLLTARNEATWSTSEHGKYRIAEIRNNMVVGTR